MARPDPNKIADILASRANEPPPAMDVYARCAEYVGYHQQHKRRISRLDALTDGRWGLVWPDGSVSSDEPKIADNITRDLDDYTALIGGPEPSTLIPALSDKDADQLAAGLERGILETYRHVNKRKRQRKRLAQDLVATGMACEVVWPDYASGYPRFLRQDPRYVYPDPDLHDPDDLSSLAVAYTTKARLLVKAYKDKPILGELFTQNELRDWESRDIKVYAFYDPDWCIKVAATEGNGRRNHRAVVLAQMPNLTGRILATVAMRVTLDGQFRGQFDKAIAPLGTANKMMEMKLAQLADEIYSERIIRGVFDNPQDIGPGADLYTTDYQASISRAETAHSSTDFYNDLNLMLQQAREASGVSSARRGVVEQSIVSGQGINALQARDATNIENYLELMAGLEQESNSKALQVDEMYLDFDKQILGVVGGASYGATYRPSKDIAGRYDNRIVYGVGSGIDAYNRNLMFIQQKQWNIVSSRYIREQSPEIPDPIAMEADIAREAVEQGILAEMADPTATDIGTRAAFAELLASGTPVLTAYAQVAKELAASRAAAAEQQQAAAEVMGGAPPAEGEGVPYLPPLAQLRGA